VCDGTTSQEDHGADSLLSPSAPSPLSSWSSLLPDIKQKEILKVIFPSHCVSFLWQNLEIIKRKSEIKLHFWQNRQPSRMTKYEKYAHTSWNSTVSVFGPAQQQQEQPRNSHTWQLHLYLLGEEA